MKSAVLEKKETTHNYRGRVIALCKEFDWLVGDTIESDNGESATIVEIPLEWWEEDAEGKRIFRQNNAAQANCLYVKNHRSDRSAMSPTCSNWTRTNR